MKGLYMVDADRGFVQYFENLLFTHAQEYRMLGHNFKANDFLMKIKERPDLLDKIDLLLINPKLNDLNGLELVKKIQSKRRDINICILVNENIKTFYENDIAELGIENVLVYPNEDSYYLESVRKVFENIENGNRKIMNQQQSTVSANVVEADIFNELNSSSFLNQFDFDSLSDDFFKSGYNKKDDANNQVNINNNQQYNMFMERDSEPVEENSFAEPNIFENRETNNNFGFEQNFDNGFAGQVGFNKPVEQFVTPNFGEEKVEETNFGFNEGTFATSNFEFEEPTFEKPIFEEPNFNQTKSFDGFNEPIYENPYKKQGQNSFGRESNVPGNPLDLTAFGVDTEKYSEPQQQSSNYQSVDRNPHNSGYGYSEQDYNVSQQNPYSNPYINEDFAMPYDNHGNVNSKTNLQNINRPDIDSVSVYDIYAENPINSNAQQGFQNSQMANNFGRHNGFPTNNGTGFNNVNNNNGRVDFNNSLNQNGFGNRMEQSNINNKNPYDEYSATRNRFDNVNNSFDTITPKENGFEPNQFGQNFRREEASVGVNLDKPNKFSGISSDKPDVNARPFGGFDFSKPSIKEEPKLNNEFDFGSQGVAPNGASLNKPSFGGNDDFGNYPPTTPNQNGYGNKSVIEGIYNNTGVDNLNYSPTINNNLNKQSPITHERANNSAYKEVPDFAKQVVAFYSTKGGIGKTSLAVNSTIQLAKYSKKKICLIDFDVTNANVHTHLGILDSTYDLGVVSNFESDIDSFSLSRIVTPYRVKDKNGDTVEFDVIVGFKEMKMSQRFSEKEVYKILCILEEMYDIVIVDTHPVYTDLAVSTILKKATKIVFVTEQDMTALNGAKDFILASKKYGIPAEKLFMVLNRYKAQTSIFTKNRIEKGLNKNILATIPSDMDSLRDAVNTNNPVTLANPDSELARAYIDVAKIIDTNLVVPEENKGFFKRFKR